MGYFIKSSKIVIFYHKEVLLVRKFTTRSALFWENFPFGTSALIVRIRAVCRHFVAQPFLRDHAGSH